MTVNLSVESLAPTAALAVGHYVAYTVSPVAFLVSEVAGFAFSYFANNESVLSVRNRGLDMVPAGKIHEYAEMGAEKLHEVAADRSAVSLMEAGAFTVAALVSSLFSSMFLPVAGIMGGMYVARTVFQVQGQLATAANSSSAAPTPAAPQTEGGRIDQ